MSERPFPEWRFERRPDGLIYYESLFSRGIRVSEEEAQVYLTGDEGAWSDIIHGRHSTEAPRPYWPGLKMRMASLPRPVSVLMALTGGGVIAESFQSASPLTRAVELAGGVVGLAFGIAAFWYSRDRSLR